MYVPVWLGTVACREFHFGYFIKIYQNIIFSREIVLRSFSNSVTVVLGKYNILPVTGTAHTGFIAVIGNLSTKIGLILSIPWVTDEMANKKCSDNK